MKKYRKIILFTYDYPTGKSENTFIEFEISKLINNFDEIELIPHKNFKEYNYKFNDKEIKVNLELSKKNNILNILYNFFSYTIFSSIFYSEIEKIIFKKKFFLKLKMAILELTYSEIAYNWLKKEKYINQQNTILYSFWSNYLLLSFVRIKKDCKKIRTISRTLGSDLDGYIKDDDYVPYINKKFYSLDKLFVLAEFQKKKLLKGKFINNEKIIINPLGIHQQNINNNLKKEKNTLIFLSCGSFIDIKNNILILDFIKKFSIKSKKKVKYYIIGDGILKTQIQKKIKDELMSVECIMIDKVENLINFIKKEDIDLFINLSSQEGMSFSIMEALSCSVPVVASNIKSNQSIINAQRGYLVDLDNKDRSFEEVINNINSEIDTTFFIQKKINANEFVNKYLLNQKCNDKFIIELNSLC